MLDLSQALFLVRCGHAPQPGTAGRTQEMLWGCAPSTYHSRAACGAASHVVFLLNAQHVLLPKLEDLGEILNDRSCLRRTGQTSHMCLTMQNHTSATLYSRFAVSSEEVRFGKVVKKHWMDDTLYVNNPTVISTILISSDWMPVIAGAFSLQTEC